MAYALQMNRPLTYVDPNADLDELIDLLIDVSTTQQASAPLSDISREFVAGFATQAAEMRQQIEDAIFHGMPKRKFEQLIKKTRRWVVDSLECFIDKYAE